MDVIKEINRDQRVRKHKIIGRVDFISLKTYLFELYDDPDFDGSLNSLWDMSHAEGISNMSIEEMRAVVLLVGSKWNNDLLVRSALVVSHELDYDLARMYEIQFGEATFNEIRVFKDVQEAEQWLGVQQAADSRP
jgi:hypothetical protein